MEMVEIEVVETVTEDVLTALIELVVVQIEFVLLLGVVPQWGSSGHSPSPAM